MNPSVLRCLCMFKLEWFQVNGIWKLLCPNCLHRRIACDCFRA